MRIIYDPAFIEKLKNTNVRIRKSFREKITIFQHNPSDPILDNHALQRELTGYRSIDITPDYRAIFEELREGEETIYFFFLFGTHKELYKLVGQQE